MAATEDHMELKIFVDKEKNRFLFAEATPCFVDTLFGFLTLPFGTIVSLIGNKATVGCFNNLYDSVTNLDYQHFWNELCKDLLLKPRSSVEKECQKLKIDVDCTEPVKYFICRHIGTEFIVPMKIYGKTPCKDCGYSDMRIVRAEERKYDVFVTKAKKFVITDDLCVMPLSHATAMGLLSKFGIQDMSVVEERTVSLGSSQLLELLKWMLLSTTPLTDLFVLKRKLPEKFMPENLKKPLLKKHSFEQDQEAMKMTVKIMLKRTDKEMLYVAAQEDFTDFLFSFLTIPLGQMVHILDGQSCLGSTDSLYKSIQALDSQYFISESHKNRLLRPKLAAHLSCKNQLFPLEMDHVSLNLNGRIRSIVNERGVDGFVCGQEGFMVMDNLCVIPFTTGSAISIFNRSKCSLTDLEERTVTLGAAEGLSILRASLSSTSALTNGLFHNLSLKDPKQEM